MQQPRFSKCIFLESFTNHNHYSGHSESKKDIESSGQILEKADFPKNLSLKKLII